MALRFLIRSAVGVRGGPRTLPRLDLLDEAFSNDDCMDIAPDVLDISLRSGMTREPIPLPKRTTSREKSDSPFAAALDFAELEDFVDELSMEGSSAEAVDSVVPVSPSVPEMLRFLRLQASRTSLPGQRGFYRGQIDILTREMAYPADKSDPGREMESRLHAYKVGTSWGAHQRDYLSNAQYKHQAEYPPPDHLYASQYTKHWSPGMPFKNRIECGAPHRQRASKRFAR